MKMPMFKRSEVYRSIKDYIASYKEIEYPDGDYNKKYDLETCLMAERLNRIACCRFYFWTKTDYHCIDIWYSLRENKFVSEESIFPKCNNNSVDFRLVQEILDYLNALYEYCD